MSYQKFISEALRSYKSSQQEQNVDYTSPTQGLSSYIMPSNVYSRFEGMSPIQASNVGGNGYVPFNPTTNMPASSPFISALLEYLQETGQSFGTEKQPLSWEQPIQERWTPPFMRGGRY